jgi:hypothetical protein
MLKKGSFIYLFIYLFICSCTNKENKSASYINQSKKVVGSEYNRVYKMANDSLLNWVKYNLANYQTQKATKWQLDSLLCFNSKADKFVSTLINQESSTTTNALNYFYGAKINNKWYFFEGAVVYLFSEYYGKPPKTPLSFSEMNEIALKEIYSGYLTKDGEINEAWFTYHFARNGQPQEEINKTIISQNKGMWLGNYNPYKKEDIFFKYNKETKQATVNFELQTPDSFYLEPMGYKILYTYKKLGSIGNTCGSAFCDIDWKKNKIAEKKIPYLPEGIDVDIYIEELFYINNQCKRLGPFTFNTSNSEKDKKNILP